MALVAFIDEWSEPIEYDLIRLGLRLRDVGTDAFTWGDLWVVIQQTPRDLNVSALYRAMNPDDWQWGLAELLIAEVADGTHVGAWQRGGGKRSDYPKPIPRPGVTETETTTIGKGAIPIDEMNAFLGWN